MFLTTLNRCFEMIDLKAEAAQAERLRREAKRHEAVAQVVGGLYSVRGYPQSTAVGDDVYLGSAEYRLHIPRLFPIQREALHIPWIGDFLWAPQQPYGRADWDLILRAFVDAAYTNQNAPSANVQIPGESDQFLIGAGTVSYTHLRAHET